MSQHVNIANILCIILVNRLHSCLKTRRALYKAPFFAAIIICTSYLFCVTYYVKRKELNKLVFFFVFIRVMFYLKLNYEYL
jgi:hypothetical protein